MRYNAEIRLKVDDYEALCPNFTHIVIEKVRISYCLLGFTPNSLTTYSQRIILFLVSIDHR